MADTRPQVRYWIPEGYVSEEGLRADVQALARRGFGAIELVAVNFFDEPMPEEARWGTERYYEAVRVVLDEASRLGLAVDISNGPGWPISVPQIKDADDPAALYELTYGLRELSLPVKGPLSLPERRVVRDEGTSVLVAACAYQVVGERVLNEATYVYLLPLVSGDALSWAPEGDGTWAIFSFWGQPACQRVLGRHYVVDHLSRQGAQASISWWEDELLPALGDQAALLRSFFCDSLEYKVAMEWTRNLPEVFFDRHGYSILPYLPVVGEPHTYPRNDVCGYAFQDGLLTRAVRRDFTETLSWMYAERHLRTLSEGAARLGKTVRYQVAYNKPFCEEDAAAVVEVPETESLGRPTLDNLRVMAGATHICRKPYLSFEAAAEFGYGYGQTQEDLMWWLKRAAIAGCGAQVLHGASYCGHGMENIAWPGWEAWNRFCSNNWNRTLSERSFHDMTEAIARINALRRERPIVDVAFWRDECLNDGHGSDGDHYVHDGGALCARGYSYEFVSPGLLEHPNAVVRDGLLDPEGTAYEALVVCGPAGITRAALRRLATRADAGLPLFVVGAGSLEPKGKADLDHLDEWRETLDGLLSKPQVTCIEDCGGLVAALGHAGVLPRASYEADSVVSAHVRTAAGETYLLYNGNHTGLDPETGKPDPATTMPAILHTDAFSEVLIDVALEGEGDPCLLDLASGKWYALEGERCGRGCRVRVVLEPDQLVALALRDARGLPTHSYLGLREQRLEAESIRAFELNRTGDLLDPLSGGFHEVECVSDLVAGYLEYAFTLDLTLRPQEAYLRLPAYRDALELDVNGIPVPVVAGLGHTVNVQDALREGENEVRIRTYTNLSNLLDKDSHQPYGLFGELAILL